MFPIGDLALLLLFDFGNELPGTPQNAPEADVLAGPPEILL